MAPKIASAANNLAKRALQAKQTGKYFGTLDFGRKALAGGAKFVGQLSQEGSEGDINLLSVGL